MMLKTLSAATLMAMLCLGLSACTTANGSSNPPAMSTGQSGGGY